MIRVYEQTFTVPPGTVPGAPFTLPVALENARLDTVRIIVPDGHFGLTGLRITWGGTQILPYNTGTWIVANDEVIDWPAGDEITANGLSLAGYNTDVFSHSFYVRFQVSDLTGTPVAAVSSAQLAPAMTATVSADVSQLAAVVPPAAGSPPETPPQALLSPAAASPAFMLASQPPS